MSFGGARSQPLLSLAIYEHERPTPPLLRHTSLSLLFFGLPRPALLCPAVPCLVLSSPPPHFFIRPCIHFHSSMRYTIKFVFPCGVIGCYKTNITPHRAPPRHTIQAAGALDLHRKCQNASVPSRARGICIPRRFGLLL